MLSLVELHLRELSNAAGTVGLTVMATNLWDCASNIGRRVRRIDDLASAELDEAFKESGQRAGKTLMAVFAGQELQKREGKGGSRGKAAEGPAKKSARPKARKKRRV